MDLFSKAVTDCFDDEIMLLNQDIDDAIFCRQKGLAHHEQIDIREVHNEDSIRVFDSQNTDDDHIILIGMEQSQNGHDDSLSVKPLIGQKNVIDDERTDFLMKRNNISYEDIPNLIVFKPTKRRHGPYNKAQPQNTSSFATNSETSSPLRRKRKNGFFRIHKKRAILAEF